MRLGISGTYCSGKTFTAMALSNYTGVPRTMARTMREILPVAAPGKALEDCTAAELVQMIVVRHVDRAIHESRLWDGFVSDGSSLQEWIYGQLRVKVGINPNASAHLAATESVAKTEELSFFEDIMSQLGAAMKRHVKNTFDAFVHLPNELAMVEDGHRPVNERFRSMSDDMLIRTLGELTIPYHVIGGSVAERLVRISATFDLAPAMDLDAAIALTTAQYTQLDARIETARTSVGAPR